MNIVKVDKRVWNNIVDKSKDVNCEIIDIAPTALYFLGFPIPEDIDGKVVAEIFEKELKPPKYMNVEQEKEIADYKILNINFFSNNIGI